MASLIGRIIALVTLFSFFACALALPKTVSRVQAPVNLCGNEDSLILQGTPWIVFNMMYNAAQTVGTQCTNFGKTQTALDGSLELVWSSTSAIQYVKST